MTKTSLPLSNRSSYYIQKYGITVAMLKKNSQPK